MPEWISVIGSMSVDDLEAARTFYGEVLGLRVREELGGLLLELPGGGAFGIYRKPDHVPATFTVLNLRVDDIERAADELIAAGVQTKIYPDDEVPTNARGVFRGAHGDRSWAHAWFRDPAGNVLSLLQTD